MTQDLGQRPASNNTLTEQVIASFVEKIIADTDIGSEHKAALLNVLSSTEISVEDLENILVEKDDAR